MARSARHRHSLQHPNVGLMSAAPSRSVVGQNLRLPHRNIGIRSTPVSRHYASEAVQPFVAPSMSSLDSDFVLRAFKSLDRLSRKRGVAEPSTLLRPDCFQFRQHLWRSGNTRRHPIDWPQAALPVLHHRRRGGRVRRGWDRVVRPHPLPAQR
jgi:hypothetical protein